MVEAYSEGGYAGKAPAAVKFFQKPEIAARVDELIAHRYDAEHKAREIATKKAGLDAAWVIERMKYGMEIALRGEPIVNEDGTPTGRFGKRDLRAFASLNAQALDVLGMRIQRVEVGGPGDFARMTDEELDQSLVATAKLLGIPDAVVQPLLLAKPVEPADEG